MESRHTVSLIIPCYRNAATLARALDSVYAQTHAADEIIVVNDCSPESEAIEQVLLNYRAVVYLRNPVNVGLAATRNNGVAVASGDIVTFLDADDELHPQKIELQLRVLRKNSAVTCGTLIIGNAGKPAQLPRYTDPDRIRVVSGVHRMLFRNSLTGAAIMLPKELLLRVGGYDVSLRSCEDFDLWLRLLQAGVAARKINLPLYLYHHNEAGLSKNLADISYWELEALKKYFARKGGEFLQPVQDAVVWSVWMLRHLLRGERCGDELLKSRTLQNIALLVGHPLLRGSLRLIHGSGIFKLLAGPGRKP